MSEETIPEMRETIERLQKERASLVKDNTKLQSDLHIRDAREAFRSGGYDPRHGDLFAAKNPEAEITEENVATFADEWNLAAVSVKSTSESEENSADLADDGTDALSAMGSGGTSTGEGGASGTATQKMTRSEWKKLMITDPASAKAAVASGKVEISGDNPWLGSDRNRAPSGSNPFVPDAPEA